MVDLRLPGQAAERGECVDHVAQAVDRLLRGGVVLPGELLGGAVVAGHAGVPGELLGERAVVLRGHLVAAAQRLRGAAVAAAVDRDPHA